MDEKVRSDIQKLAETKQPESVRFQRELVTGDVSDSDLDVGVSSDGTKLRKV